MNRFWPIFLLALSVIVVLAEAEPAITRDELLSLGFQDDPKHTEGAFFWNSLRVGEIAKRLKLDLSRFKIVKYEGAGESRVITVRGAAVRLRAHGILLPKDRLLDPNTLCDGVIFIDYSHGVLTDDAVTLRERLLKSGFSADPEKPRILSMRKISAGVVRKAFNLDSSNFFPLPSQGMDTDVRTFRLSGGIGQVSSMLKTKVQNSLDHDGTPCEVDVVLDIKK